MSCCASMKQQNNLKKPLLHQASTPSNSYGTSKDIQPKIPSFSTFCNILDPSGHLSEELVNVLDEIFMKYSNGLLIMRKKWLIQYYKKCYPNLSSEKYYDDRAQYILNKYGKNFKQVKQHLNSVLLHNKNKNNKQEIIDTYSPHTNRRRNNKIIEEDTKNNGNNNEEEEKQYNSNIIKSKHHSISIHEDKEIILKTLEYDDITNDDELVLLKTKFLLLYRKCSVDRAMMVRLELTELGYEQFRSGMIIDRTKQLDKLAFNIQQLRNRYNTHLEERKRINNAVSPNQCAQNIESFIQNNKDPLDINNDNNNLFRKRRPVKFPICCHACCCCFVGCIRCCES